jgi:acyl-[acyl-carrier-protein]-phospholipid O-acyltransferase/long-chain-fatty-acid--[acyl-carrier-protein] ligase
LFLRAGLWLISSTLVRIRVAHRHHVPEDGPVLLIGTPISFIDCLAFYASTDREVHFVMGEAIYARPLMGRLARLMQIVPVKTGASEADQAAVAETIRTLLRDGATVCINQERSTEEGATHFAWSDDYNMLLDGTEAVAVPFYQSRLWESLYTFCDGKIHWRNPKRLPFRIDIRYGERMATVLDVFHLQEQLRCLGREVHTERPLRFRLLHHGFIKMARRNLRKTAVADTISGSLSYFKTLVGSMVFARRLQKILDGKEMVGVLLPPSVGGVLVNVGLTMLGRVPINLNYTANNETIASCAAQCGVTQVLTSRKLLERLPLTVPGEVIFMEDVKSSITGVDRVVAIVLALTCPVRLLDRLMGSPLRHPDDIATVVFSSGSEGEPKGVMLTHRNLITNIDGTLEVFPNHGETCIVGFLPFFHSFGFMATLWLPLIHGVRGIYHANPLEPKVIGKLIQDYRGTLMIGTSTFLQGFIRRCEPEQLASLEFVVCGAEKLVPRVRLAFLERFGVEPLEGYGTTECSPAVAANIPGCVSPGFFSPGTKHGTIGRPIPGIEVRVVDPDTGEERGPGEDGLLQVKGPNIMRGYLNRPEKTAEVLHDGWYTTGDIAKLDEDGFITITDRLARFSKIAGEMVPHTKVEETLHSLLELTDQRLAVASVPDAQKGERLVVLHTLHADELEQLLKALARSGMPNLWAPKPSAFYSVAELPVLGTGKMDIKTIKRMALEMDRGEN